MNEEKKIEAKKQELRELMAYSIAFGWEKTYGKLYSEYKTLEIEKQ